MKKIEQKVLKFIDEKGLIENGDRILVALSGGPDSVFLLRFLVKYQKKFKIDLSAVHLNHMIRGKDAREDEQFCRNLSFSLGIKYYRVKKNVRLYAKKKNISLEEAGRNLRYKEFEKVLHKIGFNKIATAHNCSDNAETVLLNLIKGTGLKGISGIPVERKNIIRPILSLTKDEILEYLNFNKFDFRIDRTNFSSDFERSYLRNKIIPLIKDKLNPDLENAVLNSSEIFRKVSSFLDNEVLTKLNDSFEFRDDELSIPVLKLKGINDEIKSYFLKSIIEKNFSVQTVFNDYKKIIYLINKEAGREIDLSQNLKAFRERDIIVIRRKQERKSFVPIPLRIGDSVNIGTRTLTIKNVDKAPAKFSGSRQTEYISADEIKGSFVLRKWKQGERFFPIGFKGSKKISDFLNEMKVSSFNKKEQLVLTNRDRIIWVPGFRIDDRFKINNKTKKVIELCLK